MFFEHHFVTLLCAFWRDPYVMSCHKYYCNKTSFAQAKAGSSDRISLLSSVRILFFWKLVSHGGLDFSIFVSSTIWNQCFRSKNCSTAKGHLQRSCCPGTSSPLLPTELVQEKKNLRRKVYSWTCSVGKGGQCRDGAVFSRNSEAWAEPGFVMVFLWTGSSSHQQEPVGGAFQCVTGQHWVGYVIAVGSGRAVDRKDSLITPALSTCSYAPWNIQLQLLSRWNQTCHLYHQGVDPTEHHRTHLLHRLTDFSWCSESVFV